MGWLILGLFVIYGWVEFEALFIVGEMVGGLASFLGIFVTALIGLSLLRGQLQSVMATMRSQMSHGNTGIAQLAASVSLLLGAFLMLLPGYVTDMLGLVCFIPGMRDIIGAFMLRHLAGRMMSKAAGFKPGFNGASFHFSTDHNNTDRHHANDETALGDDYIDGEFSEKDSFDKDKQS